jgi:hypothetical protein
VAAVPIASQTRIKKKFITDEPYLPESWLVAGPEGPLFQDISLDVYNRLIISSGQLVHGENK